MPVFEVKWWHIKSYFQRSSDAVYQMIYNETVYHLTQEKSFMVKFTEMDKTIDSIFCKIQENWTLRRRKGFTFELFKIVDRISLKDSLYDLTLSTESVIHMISEKLYVPYNTEWCVTALFRTSALAPAHEICRYSKPLNLVDDRLCMFCLKCRLETGKHFLMKCSLYGNIRCILVYECSSLIHDFTAYM